MKKNLFYYKIVSKRGFHSISVCHIFHEGLCLSKCLLLKKQTKKVLSLT